MDRPTTRTDADPRTARSGLAAGFVPASRQPLMLAGRAALATGPVLLTGDAGIGKNWLVEHWVRHADPIRWITVDLTPADAPALLYRQLARELGLAPVGIAATGAGPGRLDIAEALAERSIDGERFGLVVDEAQNLSLDLWEEVRVLLNRFGQHDGFARMILVGQTALIRRFATRNLAAIEARLAVHLHLRPLDLGDVAGWLAERCPDRPWSSDEVEATHRDSGGNPARLIRRLANLATSSTSDAPALAGPAPLRSLAEPTSLGGVEAAPVGPTPTPTPHPAMVPAGSARPPLHVEENAIEVGWSVDEPEPTDDPMGELVDDREPTAAAVRLDETDQAVHDHYAALQAWREWAGNQEKRTRSVRRTDREIAEEIDQAAEAEAADFFGDAPTARGSTRAENHPPQPFAPFGSLFPRAQRVAGPDSIHPAT